MPGVVPSASRDQDLLLRLANGNMRTLDSALLAGVLLLIQAPPEDGLATIHGRVIDSATKLPIARARVILVRTNRGATVMGREVFETVPSEGSQDPISAHFAVLTSDKGDFSFRVVGPVKFRLFADREGYVRGEAGSSGGGSYEANPGTLKTEIVISLHPESTIAGRVIDANTRQPLPGLAVMPYRYRGIGGGRVLGPAGSSSITDKDGRYEIGGLTQSQRA